MVYTICRWEWVYTALVRLVRATAEDAVVGEGGVVEDAVLAVRVAVVVEVEMEEEVEVEMGEVEAVVGVAVAVVVVELDGWGFVWSLTLVPFASDMRCVH